MAFFAVAIAYMLRISLSYAITQMVQPPHAHENGSIISDPDICPPYEDELDAIEDDKPIPSIASVITERYDWSQELQGLILSAFYWGYILTHVPVNQFICQKYYFLRCHVFCMFLCRVVCYPRKLAENILFCLAFSLLLHSQSSRRLESPTVSLNP